ncbi:MAG: HNH endonuclease [Paracoccus sp. (in: a-proteobacteria)]|nr:HNH endonuclease [Paracoccus sp. (in: a-proteobacteria)]
MRKQRHLEDDVTLASGSDAPDPVCPLCQRPIPPDVPQSRHHLIPKLRGGKGGETVLLHHICHKTIHKTFRETELARNLCTIQSLRAHPDLARFLEWIAKRPPGFTGKVR